MLVNGICRYGSSRPSPPPQFWLCPLPSFPPTTTESSMVTMTLLRFSTSPPRVALRRLFLDHVHDVIDGDDALDAVLDVHHGDRRQARLGEHARHLLLLLVLLHGGQLGAHHLVHHALGARGEQLAKRHHAQQVLLL